MPLEQIYTHTAGKLNDELSLVGPCPSNKQKMIPWDVLIEILNKLHVDNPGVTMERVNKYINDEIYEWFDEQGRLP